MMLCKRADLNVSSFVFEIIKILPIYQLKFLLNKHENGLLSNEIRYHYIRA